MDRQAFDAAIEDYCRMYEKGLKKQANRHMEDFAQALEALGEAEREAVLLPFVRELCDGERYAMLMERGNGRIPFALDRCVRDWLYRRCLEGRMPELRWFYELYRNDRFGCQYAFGFLEEAYSSEAWDAKTVNLLFDSWIDVLGWGAHHFPEGQIIDNEARDRAIQACRKILLERPVAERLAAELEYYETLYVCYDRYCGEGRTRPFQAYCEEAGLSLLECRAYYYQ